MFAVLASERRRYVLHRLSAGNLTVFLSELVDELSRWESDSTPDGGRTLLADLYHVHLPKLADVGLVNFDTDRGTVELVVETDVIEPYLSLAGLDS